MGQLVGRQPSQRTAESIWFEIWGDRVAGPGLKMFNFLVI